MWKPAVSMGEFLTDIQAPISQAYQLIVGRVVALEEQVERIDEMYEHDPFLADVEQRTINIEDRQELLEKNAEIDGLAIVALRGAEARMDARMDDLWDTVLQALDDMNRQIPAKKTRVSYPSYIGPDDDRLKGEWHS